MTTKYLAPLWDIITPKVLVDESTQELRDTETRSTVETAGQNQISIRVDDRDSFLLFAEANLHLDVTVKCTSNSGKLTEADGVCLANPWLLFESINLRVNDANVQNTVSNPGILHHMVHLPKYSRDHAQSIGDSRMFYPLKKKDNRGAITQLLQAAGSKTVANYPNVISNGTYWFPMSKTARYQYQGLVTAHTGTDFTLAYVPSQVGDFVFRENPDYDEAYATACRRLLDNRTVVTPAILGGADTVYGDAVFSVDLPIREIFPLLRDAYCRVNRGQSLELQLTPHTNMAKAFYCENNASTNDTALVTGLSIVINRASIWCPKLKPSLESNSQYMAQVASAEKLREQYERHEILSLTNQDPNDTTAKRLILANKDRRVVRMLVGLQYDKQGSSLTRNPVQFENMNLEHIYVLVNGEMYPAKRFELGTVAGGKQGVPRMLRELYNGFGKSGEDYDTGSCVDYEGFVMGCQAIYMFDLTQMDQSPFRNGTASACELYYKLHQAVPEAYTVHIVTDTQGTLVSDMLNGTILANQV